MKRILNESYAAAKNVLTAHRADLQRVVAELLKRETLDGETLYQLIGKKMPRAKEPAPMPAEDGVMSALAAAATVPIET